MLLDLHVHSGFSPDCLSSPAALLRAARKRGLDAIAVTDHDTIQGGLAVSALNRDPTFNVIIGCEVTTEAGDIIGLFLRREIRSHKALDVIAAIHEQGGLALLPHPFHPRPPRHDVASAVDLIEVFNARVAPAANEQAYDLAARLGKISVCGSDAHFLSDVGRCRVLAEGSDARTALLSGIKRLETNYTRLYKTAASQAIKAWRQRKYGKIPFHVASTIRRFISQR